MISRIEDSSFRRNSKIIISSSCGIAFIDKFSGKAEILWEPSSQVPMLFAALPTKPSEVDAGYKQSKCECLK